MMVDLDRRGAMADAIIGPAPDSDLEYQQGPVVSARGARDKAVRALEAWGKEVQQARGMTNMTRDGLATALSLAGKRLRQEGVAALDQARQEVEQGRQQLEAKHYVSKSFIESSNGLTRAAMLAADLQTLPSAQLRALLMQGDGDAIVGLLLMPSWRRREVFAGEEDFQQIMAEAQMERLRHVKPGVHDQLEILGLWERHLQEASLGLEIHLQRHGDLGEEGQ